MKKQIVVIMIAIVVCAVVPALLSASELPGNDAPGAGINFKLENPLKGTADSIGCLVSEILKILVNIGAVVAIMFIIWSGFLFVTAQGNEAKLKSAKQAFMGAVIGTALLLGAWTIAVAITGTISKITGIDSNIQSCE